MSRILLAALFSVFVALPAQAQMKDMPMMEPMEEHGMMDEGPMDKMGAMMGICLDNADKLGLTEDQIAKLTPIHREMRKRQLRFMADYRIAEMDLHDIMEVRNFDLDKAEAAVKKIADMKKNNQIEMLKSLKEVRVIVTDEQFRKMKRMPMMREMRGPGMFPEHMH